MAGNRGEPMVFFPWERRRGFRSIFMRSRARQGLAALAGIAVFAALAGLEHDRSAVRVTRAAIADTVAAVDAWRADHDVGCPGSPADLVAAGYLSDMPRDAWGHPLRLVCPGRRDPQGFDVSSDGPDGEPGGLDRVE
jgi:general secretion pathway protein G